MNPVLRRNVYFVKEHVGFLKAANNFDIFEPERGEKILECREDNLGFFTKLFRFTDYKTMLPFDVNVRTPDGQPVVNVSRGFTIFRSHVAVKDENGAAVGSFRQRLLSIGGKFDVLDASGKDLCTLAGKWTGWEFSFRAGEIELARVTKKWAGLGKELFTTADNYVLEIKDVVEPENPLRLLILSAVLCIDMVLKESNG